jgi:hypothetical protein
MKGWHAGRMLFALARHFDWWHNQLITEFEIDGLREDLVIVSRAGYATVIEIKVSRADWVADKRKDRRGNQAARFFYAVPQWLLDRGVPAHVPDHAGILAVVGSATGGFDSVVERRAARRFKARPLTDTQLHSLHRSFYFRFWRQQMDAERVRLFGRPAMERRAAA